MGSTEPPIRKSKLHSSTWVIIERCIGLLKEKFRRLKYLDMLLIEEISYVGLAALHNISLDNEGPNLTNNDVDEDEEYEEAQSRVQTVVVQENTNALALPKRCAIGFYITG
jgi:hypothetical protein